VTVASVGDNCVDRYLGPGAVSLAGGNALNVAVGLAAGGLDSHYLGAVGDDDDGRLILAEARAAGVDVSRVRRLELPTGVTLVQLAADGERAFVEERYGASAAYRADNGDVEFLRGCGWVHCANLADPAELVERLDGVGVSYDFALDHDTPLLHRMAPRLGIAFFSGADLDSAQAGDVARGAVDAGAALAVVTRGRSGSMALNSRVVEVAAEPVNVVDTLGAGDALIAAVIAARLRGLELEEALAAGSAAAARACTHHGAWEQT
jgi:fructoselysine 6-kinase